MILRMTRRVLKGLAYYLAGALVTTIIGFVIYLDSRPDLEVWHTAKFDEEFTVESEVDNLADYLALEERLFRQLDEQVYDRIEGKDKRQINRFHRGAAADPGRWPQNWNRSFELPVDAPKAGVLLLHGMSDSPYSLRNIGLRLQTAGAQVVGLRLPGHGTAPSGLRSVKWQDMAGATRIGMKHLEEQVGNRPLYIIGYSNGGALAIEYALATLEDPDLPPLSGIVLISPSIGVSSMAAFAIWQGRLGFLLNLPKLEWSSILLEYDPFKYGSFAINAGDLVHQLTGEINSRLAQLADGGLLETMPPILAFQSVVDATVSVQAVIDVLFKRLPEGGHELVLVDIDRGEEVSPLLVGDFAKQLESLNDEQQLPFTLSLITNELTEDEKVFVRRRLPRARTVTSEPLGLSWPEAVVSLSHVALPFAANDPLYGNTAPADDSLIYLGNLSLRGEKGIFRIPPADMLRLRWNPFYPYFEQRMLELIRLQPASP
jgi:alpha-beta hydrolase superfamily lysophospholipase